MPEGESIEATPSKKKAMTGGKWTLILGALVIIAGLVYLLYELGWWSGEKDVSHWWGFLILIGTVIAWGIGWWVWNKNDRRFGWKVLRWFVIGLALVALALVFAFKQDLNEVWPVLAIIVGVGIALSWKG
jgi:drug/metabolite transporter (DMT)-like permease